MVKHPRLRAYKDDSMDLLKYFTEFQLTLVPKDQNSFSSGLALVASTCLRPWERKQYAIQEKFRPTVPNNKRYWKVFRGGKKIEDYPIEDISSFQEKPSPITDINMSSKEPEFTSEASIDSKKEEISLLVDLQVTDDNASKEHTEGAVLKADILEADNLPIMEGQEENNSHLFFVDPIEECVEAPIGSNSQAWILCKSKRHKTLSKIALILKINIQYVLWLPLTSNQGLCSFLSLLSWLHWHYCTIQS